MRKITSLLFAAAALFVTGCSSSINVISQSSEGQTIVDGNTSEWNNLTTLKNENIAFGFRNDNNYLYIAMTTNDRNKIMKIVTGGLELWLEPNNSDNKIGIKYPERPDPADIMKFREQRREMQQKGETPPPPDFLQTQNTLAIINNDGKILKEFPINGNTYQVKVTMNHEDFTYELRVPIGENQNVPDGLKIKPGEEVAVEFITGSVMQDMQRRRNDDGMGMPPGGEGMPPGGMDGRGHGGPGGPGGGMRSQNSGPLNYKFDVKLK